MDKSDQAVIRILSDLVAFQSISETPNLDIVSYIENRFETNGATFHRVPCDDGTRTNLYASIGPMVEGGIILSGHTDVVPVDRQDWTSDPFQLTERDGKLYGRGTCDMKGFLAASLALLPDMAVADMIRPIHFAFSYDEELGCLGAPYMIDELRKTLPAPAAVIVGEPTEMKVVSCHKGCLDIITHITGHSIHSSLLPKGVSAISVAAKLIGWLDARQVEAERNADLDCPIYPPFTTYHCGVINGGSASNIVAKDCTFTTDIRVTDKEDAHNHLAAYKAFINDTILPEMHAISSQTSIEVQIQADIPAFRRQNENVAEAIARAITGDNQSRASGISTEAGQFQDAGFPTIVCGPGSVEQAHQTDEFVSKDQLFAAVDFLRKIIEIQTGPKLHM